MMIEKRINFLLIVYECIISLVRIKLLKKTKESDVRYIYKLKRLQKERGIKAPSNNSLIQ
ncbi:hypothetical protein T190607A01A_40211 [Tenacibaculum sp. 190524A05c]|uniref:Uncharacterized protein n=1 Tax=Tenacibaculum platacis TaxID=3137852 RepID=A0ABM9P4M4_9FLAO